MKRIVLLRYSQLSLVVVCLLHELINFVTDIGQFSRSVDMMQKILAYPTPKVASTLLDRSIHSLLFAQFGVFVLIVMHLVVGLVLLWGLVQLLKCINTADVKQYNQRKTVCILGLVFGLLEYFFFYLVFSMDYFLSWMQGIHYNADVTVFCLLFTISLLYLALLDFQDR